VEWFEESTFSVDAVAAFKWEVRGVGFEASKGSETGLTLSDPLKIQATLTSQWTRLH